MDKAETEAIRHVLAGDRDAYRVLMDRYFCSVSRVAFRITGNEADAEEAAQEAFLRAYNKLPSFRQDSAFSTWIMRRESRMNPQSLTIPSGSQTGRPGLKSAC